ncbi:heavy metal translocating P-type ATPase [Enterococcus asini ATCC 700915]|uniref:Cd(2+)-exporting ATPase n=1 Tax=Enterococcus asini ATCC 700915 TaxID=1158606 RepID=R2PJ46_9ENTE|nr:heavy metal translocating P-type ATPase [Enterococcus asini]EOH84397.1 heavy metal translocating P-type ATPase [Enterococcus asini ATCC 700915]EOT57112.1 copper-translocating P-type ATPase [Enterococcus asini ATCC 700915]OJG11051.1 heavy metal translocating P-type ATPase [Enterococcus asini]
MQKQIMSHKNQIALVNGILVVVGFGAHFLLHNEPLEVGAFVLASILGVLPIALQAYQALRVRVVSIDLLVTIAVIGAFAIQNFEESAVVTFLFLFGAYLEQRTLNQTRSAIKELTELAPESALLQVAEGQYEEVDVDEVDEGDVLLVKTGAKVPVDGHVLRGEGHINEASITGESLPVTKSVGSDVFAGSILENGTLEIQADKVGEDTTFGKIIELVEEAQDSKSEAERLIDRFAKYYTPIVLLLALVVWAFTRNLELAITILVLGCPGALVIGVPVSNVSGIGNGARHGILLKGSEVINRFSQVDTMVFDKTGTLTIGNPEVADWQFYGNEAEKKQVFAFLGSIEEESDHPLGKAVLNWLGNFDKVPVTETKVVKGGGVTATVAGRQIAVGNLALMAQTGLTVSKAIEKDAQNFEAKGNSLVALAVDGQLVLLLGIRDQLRPGVKGVLGQLKELGVKNLVLLSGDNQGTVTLVAEELGLTEAKGNMLPEDKANYIEQLQSQGQVVAFVGDGVNDSPSLALADIGIAMGNGTDVAIETSDVVLMNSDFARLPHALGLTKATARNMKENIGIAIGVVLVLLASLIFSNWMNMTIGMFVHEGSILVVILNGMRLLRYKVK